MAAAHWKPAAYVLFVVKADVLSLEVYVRLHQVCGELPGSWQ